MQPPTDERRQGQASRISTLGRFEVFETNLAAAQADGLRGRDVKPYSELKTALAIRGCNAMAYRLSGDRIDHICNKHLHGNLRVLAAFKGTEVWILLIGNHNGDSRFDIYTQICGAAGLATPPDDTRTKPPCCDGEGFAPLVDENDLDRLREGIRQLPRHR